MKPQPSENEEVTLPGYFESDLDECPRIMITGAMGQIGSEMVPTLFKMYGNDNILSTDVRTPTPEQWPHLLTNEKSFKTLSVLDLPEYQKVAEEFKPDWLLHSAAILSAAGEKYPQKAIEVNICGFNNACEVARNHKLKVYASSSIAAFGPSTPLDDTPNTTIMRPNTCYGVAKVYTELLGEYYQHRYGVDFRCLRYPGIMSYNSEPGGGTTDFANSMFEYALKGEKYTCYLSKDTVLPFMYMPDAVTACLRLMEAPRESLTESTYNVNGFSMSPGMLVDEIRKHIPGFQVEYEPDFRQKIADSWPHSLDDAVARKDWNWAPKYNLAEMTKDMLFHMGKKFAPTPTAK